MRRPFVRRRLERLPVTRRYYRGWARTHPIDLLYGVDTSGMVSVTDLCVDPALASHMSPYAGSQPSIIRGAIATLPELADHCFIDLGCGKGRPLLVASEFPFRRIVGIELSPDLVTIARGNATAIRRRFPERPVIELVHDNVARFRLPAGKVVLFCYNSFDAEIFAQVIDAIEDGLAGQVEHLFVIYYNPVWGDLLDRSPALKRWYAGTLPYHSSELGFGPDREDSLVIWQSVRNAYARNHAGSDRRINTTVSQGHVELVG